MEHCANGSLGPTQLKISPSWIRPVGKEKAELWNRPGPRTLDKMQYEYQRLRGHIVDLRYLSNGSAKKDLFAWRWMAFKAVMHTTFLLRETFHSISDFFRRYQVEESLLERMPWHTYRSDGNLLGQEHILGISTASLKAKKRHDSIYISINRSLQDRSPSSSERKSPG